MSYLIPNYFLSLFLVQVLQRSTNTYVSCSVAVHNLERNLYVLPRARRVDKQGNESVEEVDMADVYTEFDNVRQAHKITTWASKPVERKYAFELPGIPTVAEYLKVVYAYSRRFELLFMTSCGLIQLRGFQHLTFYPLLSFIL